METAKHDLQEDNVYGYNPIEKEDCVDVKKRMGSALCNLVAKYKSPGLKSLSGKGRPMGDLNNKLSSYFSWAVKTHKHDDALRDGHILSRHFK